MSVIHLLRHSVGGGVTPLYDLADLAGTYTDVGGATQTYGILLILRDTENIDIFKDVQADLPNEQDPYTHDTAECWARLVFNTGDNIITGPTLGSWFICSTTRVWTYRHTSGGGPDEKTGTYTLSLSSDSSGSPVETTKAIILNVGEVF